MYVIVLSLDVLIYFILFLKFFNVSIFIVVKIYLCIEFNKLIYFVFFIVYVFLVF